MKKAVVAGPPVNRSNANEGANRCITDSHINSDPPRLCPLPRCVVPMSTHIPHDLRSCHPAPLHPILWGRSMGQWTLRTALNASIASSARPFFCGRVGVRLRQGKRNEQRGRRSREEKPALERRTTTGRGALLPPASDTSASRGWHDVLVEGSEGTGTGQERWTVPEGEEGALHAHSLGTPEREEQAKRPQIWRCAASASPHMGHPHGNGLHCGVHTLCHCGAPGELQDGGLDRTSLVQQREGKGGSAHVCPWGLASPPVIWALAVGLGDPYTGAGRGVAGQAASSLPDRGPRFQRS